MIAAGAPRHIVLGNVKGGSGKSTTAMHLIVALLATGRKIGALDLDARQGSLSRYLENRARTSAALLVPLAMPKWRAIEPSMADSRERAEAEDAAHLEAALADMADCDIVVIDTPGNDNALSRLAHARADILISPLNDSFLDLDLFGRVEGDGEQLGRPSHYAEMVWEQRKRRALAGRRPIDWIVLRNRLSSLDARNKRDIGRRLEGLAKRLGFRLAPGFSERVIFRELFPRGLTLLDLDRADSGIAWRMSHVAAREEVRNLVDALRLDLPALSLPGSVTGLA